MSLDYDLSGIDNWRETCLVEAPDEDERDTVLNPVTEVLIFKALSVGLHEITEANVAEWVARLAFIEALDGPSFITSDGTRSVREEEVWEHIGLKTNVMPDLTRLQFLKQQIGRRLDERKTYAHRAFTRAQKGAKHGV